MTQKQRIISAALVGLTVQTPWEHAHGGAIEPNDWLDAYQDRAAWAAELADYRADTWAPALVSVVVVTAMVVVVLVECYLFFCS